MSEAVAEVTAQELATKTGINLNILEQECSDDDLLALSELCETWEIIGRHLQLTDPQIRAIDSDHRTTEEKRLASLRKWKESKAFGATFKVFVDALLGCKYVQTARQVCEYRARQVDNRVTVASGSVEAGFSSSERTHDEQLSQVQTRQATNDSKSGMASRYKLLLCEHPILRNFILTCTCILYEYVAVIYNDTINVMYKLYTRQLYFIVHKPCTCVFYFVVNFHSWSVL